MTEKDKEINDLRRENAELRAQIETMRKIQRRLVEYVPSEKLGAIIAESLR